MKTYKIIHNDTTRFGTKVEDSDRAFDLNTFEVDFSDEAFDIARTSTGFVAYAKDSSDRFEVSPITLGDVNEIFPNSLRTFDSVEALDEYVQDSFRAQGSYAPNYETDSSEDLYLIANSNQKTLALVKEEEDSLFLRDDAEWVEVENPEDFPEVYGRAIPIRGQDVPSAILAWDLHQKLGQDPNKIFNYVAN